MIDLTPVFNWTDAVIANNLVGSGHQSKLVEPQLSDYSYLAFSVIGRPVYEL